MTQAIRFTLPLPPSINDQYITVGNRRVLSPQARRYKRTVVTALRRRLLEWSPQFVEAARAGYLALIIDFYFATPLRRDLDGGLKITQDSICEALGANDSRVVSIHLEKRIDPLRPRAEVELEVLADWAFEDERPVYPA